MCGRCEVADPLAVAEVERLELARAEHGLDEAARGSGQAAPASTSGAARTLASARRSSASARRRAEVVADLEIAREERRRLRPAPDREEVDDLDEEARPPLARAPARSRRAAEPGDEAVAADAQERTARHVADAGRLDDQHAGLALGEAAVPLEHLGRDVAVLGRPPGHHRRHPRARRPPRSGAERGSARTSGPVAASSRVGQRAGGSGCRTRSPGWRHDGHVASLPRRRGGGDPDRRPASEAVAESRGCQVGVTLSRGDSIGTPVG